MTDATSVAADQLRSIVDRILRLKEDQAAIGDDIKEIYAEAKGVGFDKTVLGQLVSLKWKQGKDAAKFAENSAIFELYLQAYDSAVHADARDSNSRANREAA